MINRLFRRLGIAGTDALGRVNYTPASGRSVISVGGRSVQQTGTIATARRVIASIRRIPAFDPNFMRRHNIVGQPLAIGPSPSGAIQIARGAGGLLTRAVEFTKRSFAPSAMLARAKYLGVIIPAAELTAYGITGKVPNPFSARKIATEAGYAIGGIPGLVAGTFTSGYTTSSNLAKKIFGKAQNFTPNLPTIPTPTIPSPSKFTDFPAPIFNVMAPPSAPQLSASGPVFAPSVSAGGGIPPELALLLLAGVGLGGYALGRKKRKKRKYKKRKRR